MTSYVFSVIDKRILWNKVYDILFQKYNDDFEMIFASYENSPELSVLKKLEKAKKNVLVLTFENNKTENEMLSYAIRQTSGDDMILCRDYFLFATVLSDVLVAMGKMGVQVALFRKEQKTNKFKAFFQKIYNKTVEFIFGFKLYKGDVGLEYFGNIPLSILKELPNNIHFTKVNRWCGFDISYVETDDLKAPVFESHEKKSILKNIIICAVATLVLIALFVVFSLLFYLKFIFALILFLLIMLGMFFLFYLFLKLSIVNKYGDIS